MKRGNLRKFGREKRLRKALYKSLETALIDHGRIKTTLAKAKTLSSLADKFITTAKKNDVASRRNLGKTFHPTIVKKLVNEIAPRFSERKGGYTRLIRLGQRKSDGSEMAIVKFAD